MKDFIPSNSYFSPSPGVPRQLFKPADKESHYIIKPTQGEGNCFFHAVFGGKNDADIYLAPTASLMRKEWHQFLSQFDLLRDLNMPPALKEQLRKSFKFFLTSLIC